MTFGEKLRLARKEKKLTQKGLASLINAAHNSISNWENDQNKPDPDTIQSLCWALDVTPNYFFLDDTTPISESATRPLPSNIMPVPKTYKVPRLGSIACGLPILAEQNIEDYDEVPEPVKCDFTLRCKGDSMVGAGIQDGDIVYIHHQETIENGEIAAVMVSDDEATLKRFKRMGDTVVLVPENSNYDPLVFTKDEITNIRIVGKVVGYTHMF